MSEPYDRMMDDETKFGVKWRLSVTKELDQTEKTGSTIFGSFRHAARNSRLPAIGASG